MADALTAAWDGFAARERGEVATRIWGLWSADATPFYVFVLRPDAAAIACLRPVRDALTNAGITAVMPAQFLHITVQSLGNLGAGGLTAAVAGRVGEDVADALAGTEPFAVRLAAVGPFGSGAFVAVHEADTTRPLVGMQRAVVDALLAANRAPVRHPDRPYQPHLSLCYFDAPHPTAPVLAALAPFRDADFGTFPVASLDLVRVVGDGTPYPPMETVRRIPFT